MTTTPDYTTYLRTARIRAQAERNRGLTSERREKAWAATRRIAAFIKEQFPEAQVRVFGSLLYPDSFGLKSDIDLAIEGIKWLDYLRVWSAVEKREPEFRIDLVDTGIVSERLRKHIEYEGLTL